MVPQTSNGHPVFDRWPFSQNHECPWVRGRIADFQRRIDKIAGISSNGRSNVRLIWPADSDEQISMHTVGGVKRARYALWTDTFECRSTSPEGLEVVEFVDVDITPPRFIFEQFHETAEEEFSPGARGDGRYSHLFTVAHHDEKCCNGKEAARGELCLGLYREPGDADLTELQRRIKARDTASHGHRAGQRISEGELAEDIANLRAWEQSYDTHVREGFLDAAKNSLAVHGWKLFNHDPGKKSNYIDLGARR